MTYGIIIFEKHPGDLLEIENHRKKKILIKIGDVKLRVHGLVKLRPDWRFEVYVELPSRNHVINELVTNLKFLIKQSEVVSYTLNYI